MASESCEYADLSLEERMSAVAESMRAGKASATREDVAASRARLAALKLHSADL